MKSIGPDPLVPLLQKELAIGERLRWSGRPRVARFNCAAMGIWLFAIPWTGFAVFWTVLAASGMGSMEDGGILRWAFPAFGVPFILVGLGMMLAPFAGLLPQPERIHGVTDRRVITLTKSKGGKVRVKSLQGRHIGPIERWEDKDGRGKLTIETHSTVDGDGKRSTETVQLIGVENVRRVGELVRELSRSAEQDDPPSEDV